MKLYYFALFTTLMTFILLLIGGIVNPMGASMACPDWYFVPTCNGELLPEMTGGVLFEHGHRLWASSVGFLTIILAISLWRSTHAKALKMCGLWALALVIIQGIMGGVTVLLGLNFVLSSLHLLTGIGFFCLLLIITLKLSPLKTSSLWTSLSMKKWYKSALHVAVLQIALGALVRHKGAILACGNDLIGCGDSFWPAWDLGKLHMTHRFIAYVLFALIMKISLSGYDKAPAKMRFWTLVPFILVLLQIALGMGAIASLRATSIVVLHTGIGALIAAILVVQVVVVRNAAKKLGEEQCIEPLLPLKN